MTGGGSEPDRKQKGVAENETDKEADLLRHCL